MDNKDSVTVTTNPSPTRRENDMEYRERLKGRGRTSEEIDNASGEVLDAIGAQYDEPRIKQIQDWSDTKPKLHLLYFKSAIIHLKAIDATIQKFHNFGNINMLDVCVALDEIRKTLIRENTAYTEAAELLASLKEADKNFK